MKTSQFCAVDDRGRFQIAEESSAISLMPPTWKELLAEALETERILRAALQRLP